MIGVTNDYKRLVALDGRRWKARVAVSNKTFEDDQIVNLVLDEATMKGESFEVGSVVSNKLTLEILNNELLTYDNVTVVPTLSLEVGASFEDVPLGAFKVADYKRDRHKVTLTCYDDMSALEFGYFPTTNPTSVANHVAQIRASSGVDLVGVFPADVVEMPLGLTYREAVGYIAAYMGGFARFNRAGKLEIRGYTGSVTEVAASYVAQAQDLQSALEYLPALEMAAAIDERELQPLIIEFELRTTETAPVLIYSLGKHSIGAWVATAGMDWQRFSIAVAPEVANAALSNTTLSFYAIYGTGIAVSARSLKVKVADGPGIDYGAYNFKVVDGTQYHSLQLAEKDVAIGKVTGQVGDELVTIGSLGHEVTIDCPFLTQARLQQLYDQLKAIRYRPYDIRAFRGDPAMEAGDQIALIDEFGVQHNTVVTHQQIRYASSVSHQLRAKGLSEKAASMQPKSKVDKAFTKIYAEQLAVKEALIGKATIQQLDAWIANVTELYATTAYVDNATVNFLTATDADIKYATIQNLTAVDGKFDDLSSVYASIVQLDAISGHITDLQTAQASIQTALVGKLDAVDITTEFLTARLAGAETAWITNAMIKDAAITSAKILEIDAALINAGILSVERLIIRGETHSLVYELNNITGALQSVNVDTINGEVLTNRSVFAEKIVAKSITANELAANTITAESGIIYSLSANVITTGTLNAARIGANTITANHLAADVGKSLDLTSNTSITLAVMQGIDNAYALRPSRNLIQNGAFEDAWDKWNSGVGNQTLGYAAGIKRQFVSHGGGTMDGYPLSSRFTLTAGKTYTLSFRFMGTSGAYITPIIYDQTAGEVMRRGYTIPTQPEAWGSYFSHTFTPTATVSKAYVMMNGSLPTDGYLYVTEFQLEEGSERMYYERNYNGKTGGLAAAINMDEEGVRITGDKVSITGRTYIQDAVITSAKISDAAITTAKIDNLAVTDAKIESLSANKIKTGILKALVGDSYINLETGVFSFVNATFESSVGATKRVEIKEGAVFSTDGTVHARLSQGQLHLFDNTNENSTSSTKLSVRTGLGICFNSGQIGFDNASSWSWGNYSGSRLGASDVSPSWTEEKTHIYSAIFEASSTYSLAAGSTAVKYVQVPSSIDLRSLGGVFVQALEGGIICTLGSNPYRSGSGGNLIELRITYRNVTDAAISTTKFRTSLMIIKRM